MPPIPTRHLSWMSMPNCPKDPDPKDLENPNPKDLETSQSAGESETESDETIESGLLVDPQLRRAVDYLRRAMATKAVATTAA